MDALPAFESFISKLHAYLPTVPDQQVVVDVKNVYYMNSATIKCLVTWIMKVRDLNENARYFVAFATNTQFAWQKRSLAAVQRLAPDIVTLT